MSQFSGMMPNLTFKDLIEHVTSIENNYNQVQLLINPNAPSEKIKTSEISK